MLFTEMYLTPENQITREIRDNRGWIIALGIVLIVLGVVAVLFPVMASFAVNLIIGAVLAASGIVELVRSVRMSTRKGLWLGVLNGVLALVIGMLLLLFPLPGVLSLALLVSVFFLVGGVLRMMLAWQLKPHDHWGWVMTSGVLALVLGALIVWQWPEAGAWIIGLLVGIDLIFAGWNSLFLAARVGPSNTAQV